MFAYMLFSIAEAHSIEPYGICICIIIHSDASKLRNYLETMIYGLFLGDSVESYLYRRAQLYVDVIL